MKRLMYSLIMFVAVCLSARTGAQATDMQATYAPSLAEVTDILPPDSVTINQTALEPFKKISAKPAIISLYDLPYSITLRSPDWHRLWVNTGVLMGAYFTTLFVLEMLPEDATSWNRAALQDIPATTRWWDHDFKEGPEWDSDNPIFNYVLHPYAGAAYFMAARSNGFNFFQSLLYSTLISTFGWEYGIEACMERPSIQDLFITPLIGSAIGECFYRLKRHIVDNDYRLWGSPVVGNIVAFLIDPVNEVVGLFNGNPARRVAKEKAAARSGFTSAIVPSVGRGAFGFKLTCSF